jgi:hypothetical protein
MEESRNGGAGRCASGERLTEIFRHDGTRGLRLTGLRPRQRGAQGPRRARL